MLDWLFIGGCAVLILVPAVLNLRERWLDARNAMEHHDARRRIRREWLRRSHGR